MARAKRYEFSKQTKRDALVRSEKRCEAVGCIGPIYRKQLCQKHYTRMKVHGHLNETRTPPGSARAWIEIALKSETDDCLYWPFAKIKNGYGQARVNGRTFRVHREVCICTYGSPPSARHEAAHNCGNRACGNPRHLRWATPKDNHADQIRHETTNRGERHGQAKLTISDVRYLRKKETLDVAFHAGRLGVSPATVRDAVSGRTWSWLNG